MGPVRKICLMLCAAFMACAAQAQQRTVAITVDDLPYVSGARITTSPASDAAAAETVNRRLLEAFKANRVPVTGFVIEKVVEDLGATGPEILRSWTQQGLDLGNHSYSHADFNQLSTEAMDAEILRGEATISPLMRQQGKRVSFFRFPMNHTGDTEAKHDAIGSFLHEHGYDIATCTIENSDYVFNDSYTLMLAKHDDAAAEKLRREYLAYTAAEIDYYAALNKRVLNYEPPEVMLIHDNQLNADVIEQLLKLFESRGYRFVSLKAAQSDAAYQAPDTYVTKYGPMWGYRWARERNVKVDGRLELEPPQWILDYGRAAR